MTLCFSRQRLSCLLLAVGLVFAVTGCGENQRDEYCATLRASQAKFGAVTNSSRDDALTTGLPLFKSLAAKAPDELADEWQTFLNAVEGFDDALDAARLSSTQRAQGTLPDTLTEAQRSRIQGAAGRLASSDVTDAAEGIEHQAADVCKVNIGL